MCSNAVYQAPDLKGSLDDTKVDWELESDFFDLRATSPVKHGMIRAAMVNNV